MFGDTYKDNFLVPGTLPSEELADTLDPSFTGGKDQCTGPVHHKYTVRKWTKYQACTNLVHPQHIQNVPCRFSSNVPGLGNGQDIQNVPDHMTTMFPLGN